MEFSGGMTGVLSAEMVRGLIHENHIFGAFSLPSFPFLPLTSTNELYRVSGSVVPVRGERVRHMLGRISATQIPLGSPLEAGCAYVVRLRETLVLPPEVHGTFFASSFFGSIHLLCDGSPFIDDISPGYLGELWAIITPHAGPTFLSIEQSLGSLAFFVGNPELPLGELLAQHHERTIFCDRSGNALFPLAHHHQLFFTLHASELQLARAGSLLHIETNECLRLPQNFCARIRFQHRMLFVPPQFEGTLSLSFFFSADVLLSPEEPLCRIEILPIIPPPTLYTPTPPENPENG